MLAQSLRCSAQKVSSINLQTDFRAQKWDCNDHNNYKCKQIQEIDRMGLEGGDEKPKNKQ